MTSDWSIYTYIPASGFRLDFSALDGSDTLGLSEGSIGQLTGLKLASINLREGGTVEQGVFGQFQPSTLAFSAQMTSYDATTIKELYNGKLIFLTLKNEAVNSHPTFGKNTVWFIGNIDDLQIDIDPFNLSTTVTVTATDVLSQIVNYPVSITTSTVTGKAAQITSAISTLQTAGQISPWINTSLYGFLGATYEANASVSKSMGDWLADYLISEVAIPYSGCYTYYSAGTWSVNSSLTAYTVSANSKAGEVIPQTMIYTAGVAQDGANVPTGFNLANSAATYSYGDTTANTFSNPRVYTTSIDVPTAFLQTIANKIREFKPATQITSVDVITARQYQNITFDNSRSLYGTDYFFPKYYWRCGQEVKTIPTYMANGGVTPIYYHQVVGIEHTIDVETWKTTYTLWKGL